MAKPITAPVSPPIAIPVGDSHSPHRVVESALARIEVFTPIPAPGTTTPPGAHTHFLPQFLATGDEAPAGLGLPDYALPVAIYYPSPEASANAVGGEITRLT